MILNNGQDAEIFGNLFSAGEGTILGQCKEALFVSGRAFFFSEGWQLRTLLLAVVLLLFVFLYRVMDSGLTVYAFRADGSRKYLGKLFLHTRDGQYEITFPEKYIDAAETTKYLIRGNEELSGKRNGCRSICVRYSFGEWSGYVEVPVARIMRFHLVMPELLC